MTKNDYEKNDGYEKKPEPGDYEKKPIFVIEGYNTAAWLYRQLNLNPKKGKPGYTTKYPCSLEVAVQHMVEVLTAHNKEGEAIQFTSPEQISKQMEDATNRILAQIDVIRENGKEKIIVHNSH